MRPFHCLFCGAFVHEPGRRFCSRLCEERAVARKQALTAPTVLEVYERRQAWKAAEDRIERLVEDKRDEFVCPERCGGNPNFMCSTCVNLPDEEITEIVEEYRRELEEEAIRKFALDSPPGSGMVGSC